MLLGVLFALAFCPTSGVFYFGMLIPLSAAETGGYLLPVIYAIATGLPVILFAWILAYSVAGLGKFYNRIQIFEKWFRKNSCYSLYRSWNILRNSILSINKH